MNDPIKEALETSQQIRMTSEGWFSLALAFVLSGTTSAFWILRQGRRWPSKREWISSFVLSGLVAAAIIAFLLGRGIPMHMVIFIAIMVGIGGDVSAKILRNMGVAILKSLLQASSKGEGETPADNDKP